MDYSVFTVNTEYFFLLSIFCFVWKVVLIVKIKVKKWRQIKLKLSIFVSAVFMAEIAPSETKERILFTQLIKIMW